MDPTLGAFVNVYQNNRLRPILVQVSVECTQNIVGNMARFVAYTGAGPNPANVAGYGGLRGLAGAGTGFEHFYLAFMVEPGQYYRVAADQGAGNVVALNIWIEIEL